MSWVWWAVGGAFLLGGSLGVLVMALLVASREPRAESRDELGTGS